MLLRAGQARGIWLIWADTRFAEQIALTRLDGFIRRLTAQRACLDTAIAMIGDRPGAILELGLGNGRSFDHLRAKMPGHRIVVIERDPKPHPACMPACADLLVGCFEELLPQAPDLLPDDFILVHADIGTGDDVRNAKLAALIAQQLENFLPPMVASSQVIRHSDDRCLQPLPVPEGVE